MAEDTWINDVVKGHAKIEALIAEAAAEAFAKHYGKPMPAGVAGLYSAKMRGGQFLLSFNDTKAQAAIKSGKASGMTPEAKEAMGVLKEAGLTGAKAKAQIADWVKAGALDEADAAWVVKALEAGDKPKLALTVGKAKAPLKVA